MLDPFSFTVLGGTIGSTIGGLAAMGIAAAAIKGWKKYTESNCRIVKEFRRNLMNRLKKRSKLEALVLKTTSNKHQPILESEIRKIAEETQDSEENRFLVLKTIQVGQKSHSFYTIYKCVDLLNNLINIDRRLLRESPCLEMIYTIFHPRQGILNTFRIHSLIITKKK